MQSRCPVRPAKVGRPGAGGCLEDPRRPEAEAGFADSPVWLDAFSREGPSAMVFKSIWISFWLTVFGLSTVYLQVVQVKAGNRVHKAMNEIEVLDENLRRLELRWNRLVSPDVLEQDLNEFYVEGEILTGA